MFFDGANSQKLVGFLDIVSVVFVAEVVIVDAGTVCDTFPAAGGEISGRPELEVRRPVSRSILLQP